MTRKLTAHPAALDDAARVVPARRGAVVARLMIDRLGSARLGRDARRA